MKKVLYIIIILSFQTNTYANENQSAVSQPNDYLDYEETAGGGWYIYKLNKNLNGIFLGSILIGCSPVSASLPVGLILSAYRFGPIQIEGGIAGDILFMSGVALLCVGSIGMLINGIIFTSICNYNYYYKVKELEMHRLAGWLEKKSKKFMKTAIPNIAVSGSSFLITIAGIFMTAFGYVKDLQPLIENQQYLTNIPKGRFIVSDMYLVDGLYVAGILLDIFGAVGLGICLPMMIASLAMYAWCKGQARKFTPDLSITHDDKKSFNEGYGVSVGMRVRI